MKKFLSIFVAALFCANLSAQTLNEGFEGEGFPPEDWSVIDGYAGWGWKKAVKMGHNCAKIQEVSGTENWIITPQLRPAAGESLTFSACIGDYASKGELRIEVSMSGTDAGSFEVLDTYYTSQSKGDAAHRLWKTEWRDYTINLSAYKGQAIYIGFHQAGETDGIFIDDVKGVSLVGNADCENPSNIVLSNLSAHAATFTWEGAAAEYQYLLVEQGDEPDWSWATKIAEKTVTLSNLYEETDYAFYVRSYCSETAQSLAPKTAFRTPCESFDVPWLETFTRDATGAIAPDCWTVSSATPQVWVVADKTYDDEGTTVVQQGQAHLGVSGGGPASEQVFAMPTFNAPLNTLEVAFDYHTNMVDVNYGVLEVGYMTNPNKASTFISLKSLPQTLTDRHEIVTLEDLPADASFIAFRFAGGTSNFGSLSMDNFVVAEIGKSGEVTPDDEIVPDANIYGLTYCEAQFTWFSYNTSAFAIGLFNAESEALVAGIVATTEECDRFAYQDGVGFSEDEDYENKYYCSTKWILNVDESGMQRGAAWESSVINVGTAASPILGLKAGKYQVQIYELNQSESGYSKGALLATIPFELVAKYVQNLKADVAEDKQTATITWEAPELAQGERLYVRVWAGETVAFDNFSTKERPESPLTVSVVEGKSYTAIVQVVDKNNNPLGEEVSCEFTVGVNNYEPKNPHAEVFGGDNVTFTWEAADVADRYQITLYLNGEFYATLTVSGTSKMTTMPQDGTWTWTVQAFNQGTNGNYFEASNAIEGNSFETKAADVPEDAVEFDIWAFEAAYLDKNCPYYIEGKHGWFLQFATGEEGNQLPAAYFLVYTNKEDAISGVYNVARGNIDLESCYIDNTGKQADATTAVDAEVRLQFDGFDEDYFAQGYAYGYYTGQFRLVGNDGKTYVAKFMELFCNSYNFSSMSTGLLDHHGMWDEEPGEQGVENTASDTNTNVRKVLKDGQLFIIRDGKTFNLQGVLVK